MFSSNDLPENLEDAFDLSTDLIQEWELKKIRQAVEDDEILVGSHWQDKAFDLDFDIDDCYKIITSGKPREKDLPYNDKKRTVGISFVGKFDDGRRFLVKVTWNGSFYELATSYKI